MPGNEYYAAMMVRPVSLVVTEWGLGCEDAKYGYGAWVLMPRDGKMLLRQSNKRPRHPIPLTSFSTHFIMNHLHCNHRI